MEVKSVEAFIPLVDINYEKSAKYNTELNHSRMGFCS